MIKTFNQRCLKHTQKISLKKILLICANCLPCLSVHFDSIAFLLQCISYLKDYFIALNHRVFVIVLNVQQNFNKIC